MLFCLISLVGTASAEDISDTHIMSYDNTIDISTENSVNQVSNLNSNDMSNEMINADDTADDASLDDVNGSSSKNVLGANRLSANHDLSGLTTFEELQNYLDTQSFSDGDVLYLGNHSLTGSSAIDVNIANIVISGGTEGNPTALSTLTANGCNIFNLNAAGITLQNLAFVDGTNTEGGAIYIEYTATGTTIQGCVFSNNKAPYEDYGSYSNPGIGGSIYCTAPNLSVSNCNFSDCEASNGGAIYLDSYANGAVINDCTFSNNNASCYYTQRDQWSPRQYNKGYGGAIYSGASFSVNGCDFDENSATGDAGAIYLESTSRNSNITNCSFRKNDAKTISYTADEEWQSTYLSSNGGSIYSSSENTVIKGCNFTDSNASNGGVIYLDDAVQNAQLENCSFDESNAQVFEYEKYGNQHEGGIGGAIYSNAVTTNFTSCSFNNGNASNGGAVYLDSRVSNSEFTNCNLTNNSVSAYVNQWGNVEDGKGGAVYSKAGSTNFTSCNCEGNNASSGGAVYLTSNVKNPHFNDCNFTSNSVSSIVDQWGNIRGGEGGAVNIDSNNTIIENSVFKDNNATNVGGAIYSNSVGNEVRFANFTSNNAGDGGAIQLGGNNNDFDIEHTVFKDNYAHATKNGHYYIDDEGNGIPAYDGGNGGAINSESHTEVNHNILNVTFINNTADKSGGAVKHHSNWTFVDCVFEDNSANPNDNKLFASDEIVFGGGALWCCDGLTTISNTNFTNNNATFGGAIRGAVNAKDCTFDQNTAFDGNGGGIDMTIDATVFPTLSSVVNIQDCIFTDNEAKGEYAPRGDAKGGKSQGGAIHSYKIEGMVIDNITCTGNTAFRGGAIDLYEMNFTTISNSKFEENEATLGGGIAVVGDNCNFTNLTMSYNIGNDGEYDDGHEYLDGQGGGIWVNGSNTRFENSTLDNNMATFGGGIMSLGDDGTFVNNTLTENMAAMGGAIAVDSGDDDPQAENITFFNNTIQDNYAFLGGGGVFVQGDDVNFTDNDISYNEATSGGAFWVYGNHLYVENLTSIENTAQNGGSSAVYSCDGLVVKNSTFIGNTATGRIENNRGLGGAFHLSDATNVDIQANFYNNTAINGSAIYSEKTTGVFIHDSDFVDNQAYSYFLNISPENNTVLSQNEAFNISVTHIGGDNIINAIYNDGGSNDIGFTNVTYPFLTVDGQEIIRNTNDGKDPTEVIHPVIGVENSDNGNLLYQDDLENNQIINVLVKDKNGNLAKDINGRDLNFTGLKSDIWGTVTELIPGLAPGKYYVEAAHPEDTYYKEIYNLTILKIGPTDLEINKTVSNQTCNVSDLVDWNVTTVNNGPFDALNTTISDLLPNGLNLTNLTFSFYDENKTLWTNGTLDINTNTLTYSVYNETGDTWINGTAIYDASTNTWTYYVVNLGNNTFTYDVFNPSYFTDMFGDVTYDASTQAYNFVHIAYNNGTGNWSYYNLDYNGENVTYSIFNETYFIDEFGQARYDERSGKWVFNKIAYDPVTGNWSYNILTYNEKDYTYTVFDPDYFSTLFGDYSHNEGSSIWIYKNLSYNEATGNWSYYTFRANGKTINYGGFNESYFLDELGPAYYDASTHTWVFRNITYNEDTGNWSYHTLKYDGTNYVYGVFNETYFIDSFGDVVYDESTHSYVYKDLFYDVIEETWNNYLIKWNGQNITYGSFKPEYFTDIFGEATYDGSGNWVYRNISYNENSGNWNYYVFYFLDNGDDHKVTYSTFNPDYFTDLFGQYYFDEGSNSWIYENASYNVGTGNWIVNGIQQEPKLITMAPQKVVLGPNNTTEKPDYIELSPNFVSMEPEHYTFEPFKITLSMNDTSEGKRIALFISNLTEDSSVVMNLVTNVTRPGEYLNLANVTTDSPERNYTNNFANNTTKAMADSSIEVIKIANDEFVYVGNETSFTIVVINNGGSTLTNVNVTDTDFSNGLEFNDVWSDPNNNWTYHGNGYWTLNNPLPAGENASFTVYFNVTTNGTLVNNVTANSTETNETNATNKTKAFLPNMTVQKITVDNVTYVGNNTSFIIVVTNTGDCNLTGVYVVDDDYNRTGLSYIGYENSTDYKWNYTGGKWFYDGVLLPGDSANFTVNFTVIGTGVLVNNVTAGSNESNETNGTNNTTAYAPNMTVQKITVENVTYVGNITHFVIVVTNTGDCNLTGVYVVDDDYNHTGLQYVGYENSTDYKWNYTGGKWFYDGVLLPGDSANFTVNFTVIGTGVLVNNVTAGSNESNETNGTNNTTAYAPNMTVQKITVENVTYVGNITHFVIVVTNTGDCNLTGVYVVDDDYNHTGLQYVGYENSTDYKWNYTGGKWFYDGVLLPGDSANFTVNFTVIGTGVLVNNVTAGSNESNETNGTNNTTAYAPNMTVQKITVENVTYVGNITHFVIVVTNTGDCNLTGVYVVDDDYNHTGLSYIGYENSTDYKWNYTGGKWFYDGVLLPGDSANFTVNFTVIGTGVLVNNVTAGSNESNETNGTNNTTAYAPNMTVQKITVENVTYVGNITHFVIVVTNTGDCNLTGVYVVDDDYNHTGLSYIGYENSTDYKWNYTGGKWFYDGVLLPGDSANFTVNFTVIGTGVLVNNVTAGSNESNETNGTNNTTAYAPNMTVQKITVENVTYVGNITHFVIVVTNTGDCNLTGVYVVDDDYNRTGLSYIGYENSTDYKWNYTGGKWFYDGVLLPGDSANFTVNFTVIGTGVLVNNVTAGSNESNETNGTNNTTAYAPNMTVQKITVENVTYVGNITHFVIVVTNTGDCNLTGVYVVDDDYNRTGLSYIGYENSTDYKWNYTGGKWFYDGVLLPGDSANFTVNFTVIGTGVLVNNVTAGSNESNETNGTNNTTAYAPNMTVQKITVDNVTYVGNNTSFIIVVTNTGDCNLTGVYVVDDDYNHTGLQYVGYENSTDYKWNYTGGKWFYDGILEPGKSANFTVNFTVIGTGVLVNNVTAGSNESNETNGTNNTTAYAPNMTVQKISVDKVVFVGNNTSFIIVVTNTGDCNLTGVYVVDDDYDHNGLQYVGYENSTDYKWNYTGGKWFYDGILEPGKSANFTVNFTVIGTGVLVNNVTAGSNESNETNGTNNTTAYAPNITVQKITVDNVTYVGNNTSFIIVVTNTGDCNLTGVYVVDDDYNHTGLQYVGYENSTDYKWNYTGGKWFYDGILEPGKSANFTVNFTVIGTGVLVNNVTAGSNESNETNGTNNTTAYAPNMTVQKITVDEIIYVGNNTSFIIVVTNTGDCNLTGVYVVDDDYDHNGLSYIGYENSTDYKWNYTDGKWFYDGILEPGQSANFTVNFTVIGTGVLVNNVTAGSNESNETNGTNNTTAYAPNMTVQKVTIDQEVYVGNTTRFTIVVENTGDCVLDKVYVVDTDYDHSALQYLRYENGSRNWNYDGNGNWSLIGALAVGEKANFTVWFEVLTNGTFVNNVSAGSNLTNETNGTNNTTGKPICDLGIVKIVNATNCNIGDLVEWNITIMNHGPSAASNVIVKDVLPNGLELVDYKVDVGIFTKGINEWSVGTLEKDTPVSLILVTKVLIDGTFLNIATVNTTTPESDYTNNEANNTTVADPICDLVISKIVNASKVYKGDLVKWTIKVTNNGPSTALNVKVRDVLPDGLKFVSYKASQGKYQNGVWTIGKLTNGSSATLTLITKTTKVGNITNFASASTDTPESNYSNNEANNTTEVINEPLPPSCDLVIYKSSDKTKYHVNDVMHWIIKVVNNGPDGAKGVYVKDALPVSTKFIKYSASKGSFDAAKGVWKIGDLDYGEEVTLIITCRVLSSGSITNEAVVNSSTVDTNVSNNYDNATIIVKADNPPVPNPIEPKTNGIDLSLKTGNPLLLVLLAFLSIFTVIGIKHREE